MGEEDEEDDEDDEDDEDEDDDDDMDEDDEEEDDDEAAGNKEVNLLPLSSLPPPLLFSSRLISPPFTADRPSGHSRPWSTSQYARKQD